MEITIMQLKAYLKQHSIKISDISREYSIPYTTVNEIINGKIDIDRVQIGTGLQIAKACHLPFDDFYDMCKRSYALPNILNGKIVKKNKAYYLQYTIDNTNGEIYLCKITPTNTHFVKDMAEWSMQAIINDNAQQKAINEVEAWTIDSI